MVNIPTVWGYSGSGVQTHHNSEDTPDRVDPRSLRDISAVIAVYLYYLANAGEPEALWLAELSQTRGYQQMLQTLTPFLDRIALAANRQALGELLSDALDHVAYSSGRESQAVSSVLPVVPDAQHGEFRKTIAPMIESLRRFADDQGARIRRAVQARVGNGDIANGVGVQPAPVARRVEPGGVEERVVLLVELAPPAAGERVVRGHARGLPVIGRERDLDPLAAHLSLSLGHVLFDAKHFDEAIESWRRVWRIYRNRSRMPAWYRTVS